MEAWADGGGEFGRPSRAAVTPRFGCSWFGSIKRLRECSEARAVARGEFDGEVGVDLLHVEVVPDVTLDEADEEGLRGDRCLPVVAVRGERPEDVLVVGYDG
jgi:hypothetical protein